jgi:SAM-dependent methyltransferase
MSAPETSGSFEVWRDNLHHELDFWDRWLTEDEWEWHRKARLSPEYIFPMFARRLLKTEPGGHLDVLDVGSGPASVIGTNWPERTVTVTMVDPLADEFNAALERAGYGEWARVLKGSAEDLGQLFDRPAFDFVFCGNALDHMYDPVGALQNLIDVTKPGGWTMAICYEDEGAFENYDGLHQWNFRREGEDLVLWTPSSRQHPLKDLRGLQQALVEPFPQHESETRPRIMINLQKAG